MARQLATLFILLTSLHLGCADPAPSPSGEDAAPDLVTSAPDAAPDLAPPPAKPIGATCQEDAQCADGACLLDPKWPSGYCTTAAMDAATCTSIGGVQLATSEQEQVCARFCATSQDCRFGYACYRDRDTKDTGCLPTALVPAPPVVVVTPEGTPDGSPCEADEDCTSGQCLTGERWPDGYCSTQPCGVNALCHPFPDGQPVVCAQPADLTLPTCLAVCSDTADCRAGYQCDGFDGVNRYCLAIPQRQFTGFPFELNTYPLPLRCEPTIDNKLVISYSLIQSQRAHSLVVFSPTGQFVDADEIKSPVATFDPKIFYAFHFDNAPRWLKVLLMPGPSNMASKHGAGDYQVTYRSSDTNLCWYLLPHTALGRTIDLNIYLPGNPQVSAVEQLDGLAATLSYAKAILSPYLITLRPRILPLPEEAHTALGYVRTFSDLNDLNAYTVRSIQEGDSPLSVNLFLVKGFADSNLLGISPGLPGPPGLHGTPVSGFFAMAPSSTSQTQSALASTIVHELGHHLGLRHTSEQFFGQDPLEDTPYCSHVYNDPYSCPDIYNLMFPFNITGNRAMITTGQVIMLRANPLVRP
jgi:hypothetical protein